MTAADYKSKRQQRGTQQGVAALLGVDYRTIQRRECGDIEITREAEMALLAIPLVRWAAGAGRGAVNVCEQSAAGSPSAEVSDSRR